MLLKNKGGILFENSSNNGGSPASFSNGAAMPTSIKMAPDVVITIINDMLWYRTAIASAITLTGEYCGEGLNRGGIGAILHMY